MKNKEEKLAKQILDNSIYGVYNKEMDEKITIEAIEIRKKLINIFIDNNINIELNNTDTL